LLAKGQGPDTNHLTRGGLDMTNGKRAGLTVAVAVALTGGLALQSSEAEAHGRGGGRRVVYGGGFYNPWFGFGPSWGWGWGGGWGGYPAAYYEPEGGVSMGAAMIAGMGAVQLNVKPNRADVWVDGKYVGEARDLDGYPSYLWLAEGEHRVAVHKGGFLVFDEPIHVQRGMKTQIKLKMHPGDSPPPGPKPAGNAAGNDKKLD
jgi:hypothetical protein